MENYFDKVNHDYVRNFADELGLKGYYVDKRKDGWYIIFDDPRKIGDYLVVTNYMVSAGMNKELSNVATKLWVKKMYKTFGKKYLRDLKAYKLFHLRIDTGIKKKIIKEEINKMKYENLER